VPALPHRTFSVAAWFMVLCDVISAVTEFMVIAFSVAAWFMVLRDVISSVAEFMVIDLQCCGMIYSVNR
jgi:hypothetical protein